MEMLLRLALTAFVAGIAALASIGLRRHFAGYKLPGRFDRTDVDVSQDGPLLVEFTSPYCSECQTALPLLEEAARTHSAPLAIIDARHRPDLTRKYSIRSTPTILVVDGRGKVTEGWKVSPPAQELFRALALATAD